MRKAVGRGGCSTRTPFGTSLSLFREEVVQELWQDDLRWVPMVEGAVRDDPSSVMGAGRTLEIFLDHVLARTASTGHLMDPRFDAVLSGPERTLRDCLSRFLAEIEQLGPGVSRTPAWAHVERMLRSLGG